MNRWEKDTRPEARKASAAVQLGSSTELWRNPEKRAEFENALLNRIGEDVNAKRYLAYLVRKGFNSHYVVGSLIRDACGYKVPKTLSANPNVDFLKEYGSLTLAQRVRNLADEVEQAESGTPDFGIDQLPKFMATTSRQREKAARDLRKLPQTLRLYAEYFDASRNSWRVMGKLTKEAKEAYERLVRDRLQMEIFQRTGKHSDLRYSRLVNLAREVVGKDPIDEKALLARRKRRQSSR